MNTKEEGNLKNKIPERIKSLGPSFYMNITAMIQSFALGFLLYSIDPKSKTSVFWGPTATPIAWFQGVAVFELIVSLWHINVSNCMIFSYVLGWADSVIPFSFGIAEYLLILYITPEKIDCWFYLLSFFCAITLWAYLDMFYKLKKEKENLKIFNIMSSHKIKIFNFFRVNYKQFVLIYMIMASTFSLVCGRLIFWLTTYAKFWDKLLVLCMNVTVFLFFFIDTHLKKVMFLQEDLTPQKRKTSWLKWVLYIE